jgi:hypothetical protein
MLLIVVYMEGATLSEDGDMTAVNHADYRSEYAKLRESILREQIDRQRRASQALAVVALVLFVFALAILAGFRSKPEWETIVLVACVSAAVALPLFSKISFSKEGGGVEMRDPIAMIDEMEARAQAARSVSYEQIQQHIGALSVQISELAKELTRKSTEPTDVDATDQTIELTLRQIRRQLPEPTVEDDPQRGRFGGSNQSASRILTAEVSESVFGPSWQKLVFRVSSRDGSALEAKYAYFFLHDTFSPDTYRVKIKEGASSVELETASKGAFTVGVVTDNGRTKLELDLAAPEVKAPKWWKER